MGNDSKFMELFLKALAYNKRTDTGVAKIEIFLPCISLECYKYDKIQMYTFLILNSQALGAKSKRCEGSPKIQNCSWNMNFMVSSLDV